GSGDRSERQRSGHAALRRRCTGRGASQSAERIAGRSRARRSDVPAARLSAGAPGARVERRRPGGDPRGADSDDAGGPAACGGLTEEEDVVEATVKRRVLVVDDEGGVGESLPMTLTDEYETIAVGSA